MSKVSHQHPLEQGKHAPDAPSVVIQAEPIRMRRVPAAQYLGISPRQLQYLVARGLIPFVLDSDNGERLFLTSDLRAYAESQPKHRRVETAA